jgi:single-strand DNA-binding protein
MTFEAGGSLRPRSFEEAIMNVVILSGQLSSDPRCTELPSGELRWSIELSTPTNEGATTVPVAWHGTLPDDRWRAGTQLCVAGEVRRRFFRSGGTTQSRTEVLAAAMVELTSRRSAAVALRQVMRVLDHDQAARLRSGLPALE